MLLAVGELWQLEWLLCRGGGHLLCGKLDIFHYPTSHADVPCFAPAVQLTALTGLHSLRLKRAGSMPEGFTVLTRLSSLRRLALSDSHLPACLSHLTGLEALSIDAFEEAPDITEGAAALVHSMSQLTNLTHLALAGFVTPGLEAAFPSLRRLRSLWWFTCGEPSEGALPGGGWLGSLQRLAVPIRELHSSLPALGSARGLRILGIDAYECSDLLPAVLRWAAQRPSLEEVVLEISSEELNSHFQAIMQVQRSVPRLRIERHTNLTQLPRFCAID
jgi:hypothetical protein